jgi:hypothetical protein
MDSVVEKLQRVGLTEYEAKAYISGDANHKRFFKRLKSSSNLFRIFGNRMAAEG